MTRPGPIIVGGFLVFGVVLQASAGQPAAAAPEEAAVAFVNVNLIRMDRERVETGRTVLTRGGRIAAIGARSAVTVPDDALVIQGEGRFLTRGLTDTHVHLVGDGTAFSGGAARPDFGDAPLYLAHGVMNPRTARVEAADRERRTCRADHLHVGPVRQRAARE